MAMTRVVHDSERRYVIPYSTTSTRPMVLPPLLCSRPSHLAKAVYAGSTRAPAKPRTTFHRSQAATPTLDVLQVGVYDTGIKFEDTATSAFFDSPHLTVRGPVDDKDLSKLHKSQDMPLVTGSTASVYYVLPQRGRPTKNLPLVQPVLCPCVYVQWVDAEGRPFRLLRMTGRPHPGQLLDPDS